MKSDIKVLFVDDDASSRLIAENMFQRNGITCLVFAMNGCDAHRTLVKCAEHKKRLPDCVVSDWMMPLVDGMNLLTRLKKDERFTHIPFILISGTMTERRRQAAEKAGAVGCFQKPVNFHELIAFIHKAVEKAP